MQPFTSAAIWFKELVYYVRHYKAVRKFRHKLGHWPSVMFPRTYNEKMQWRKLFDRDPRIAQLTDKLLVKQYFHDKCPDLNVITPLWVGTNARDIPGELLQQDTVVKTNHGCGFNLFVQQNEMSREAINKRVNEWLKVSYGESRNEWAYSQIERKVFIEPVLKFRPSGDLMDFNFEVFDGEVLSSFVMIGKTSANLRVGLFDAEGERLPGSTDGYLEPDKRIPPDFKLPIVYHDAVKFARKLGAGFDNVRVDFMCDGDAVYGCEMTFYSRSGFACIYTDDDLYNQVSRAWDLRKSWFLKKPHLGWKRRYAEALYEHAQEEQELGQAADAPNLARHNLHLHSKQ